MHVGINTDIGLTSERYNQHKIGSLSPDAWQCQQFVHRRWHLLVESGHQLAARLLHMSRFISIEADGIDDDNNIDIDDDIDDYIEVDDIIDDIEQDGIEEIPDIWDATVNGNIIEIRARIFDAAGNLSLIHI